MPKETIIIFPPAAISEMRRSVCTILFYLLPGLQNIKSNTEKSTISLLLSYTEKQGYFLQQTQYDRIIKKPLMIKAALDPAVFLDILFFPKKQMLSPWRNLQKHLQFLQKYCIISLYKIIGKFSLIRKNFPRKECLQYVKTRFRKGYAEQSTRRQVRRRSVQHQ